MISPQLILNDYLITIIANIMLSLKPYLIRRVYIWISWCIVGNTSNASPRVHSSWNTNYESNTYLLHWISDPKRILAFDTSTTSLCSILHHSTLVGYSEGVLGLHRSYLLTARFSPVHSKWPSLRSRAAIISLIILGAATSYSSSLFFLRFHLLYLHLW